MQNLDGSAKKVVMMKQIPIQTLLKTPLKKLKEKITRMTDQRDKNLRICKVKANIQFSHQNH